MEKWKTINDNPDYEISNHGRVKSNKNNKTIYLKPGVGSHGYYVVSLDSKSHMVSHLVWDTFGTDKRDGHKRVVDHIDSDKLNNHINNLRTQTTSENVSRGWDKTKTSSKYKGVYKYNGKYRAIAYINGKKVNGKGYHETEDEAYEVYKKLIKLRRYEKI